VRARPPRFDREPSAQPAACTDQDLTPVARRQPLSERAEVELRDLDVAAQRYLQ
jgi:hypothetical protein